MSLKVVLTGAPSSGKTTALKHLANREDILLVPEAASQLLAEGYPAPLEPKDWTQDWQDGFQKEVYKRQVELEDKALKDLKANGQQIMVLDRGRRDSEAYLANGAADFDSMTGETRNQSYAYYDAVIYLGWIGSNTYSSESNEYRYENEQRAKMLASRTLEAWSQHPNLVQIDSETERWLKVESLIDDLASKL